MAVPVGDILVRVHRGNQDPFVDDMSSTHRTRVRDDLNSLRLVTETRQHNVLEDVALENRSTETNRASLFVEVVGFDRIHLQASLDSHPKGPLPVRVHKDLDVASAITPPREDVVQDGLQPAPLLEPLDE